VKDLVLEAVSLLLHWSRETLTFQDDSNVRDLALFCGICTVRAILRGKH
jgi:hypothetical protein